MLYSVTSTQRPQTVPNFVKINKEKTDNNENIWRHHVQTEININNKAIDKSDRNIYISKHDDPLTNLREVLRTLSNTEAFKYMRQCRLIVAKLKKCWVDVNEEVKSLSKNKEYLESAIDHVRKDIIINKEIIDNRVHKPLTEPSEDRVDDLLENEKQTLIYLKKSLEAILKPIQEQLYKLDAIRDTVFKLCRERSSVTDLICQCLTQSIRNYDRAVLNKPSKSSINSRSQPNLAFTSQSFCNDPMLNEIEGFKYNTPIGPLNAFTQESIDIIKEASNHIADGRDLRIRSKILMRDCIENAKRINESVNDAFVRKIEETLALCKNLSVSNAENRLAINRAVRWQDLTNISLKYTLGPEKSTNLNLYEQLDRPIIKTFQKHPGNQVPEAQEISKATDQLSKSVATSEKHIKTLKIIGQRLESNIKEKEAQHSIDCALLRRRRELSDHRWVPEKYVKNK